MKHNCSNLKLVDSADGRESNPDFLTSKEAAEILRVTAGTLAVWRRTKSQNLRHICVGRNIFYERSDVYAFMRSKKIAN